MIRTDGSPMNHSIQSALTPLSFEVVQYYYWWSKSSYTTVQYWGHVINDTARNDTARNDNR